jgi:hypothetical protein
MSSGSDRASLGTRSVSRASPGAGPRKVLSIKSTSIIPGSEEARNNFLAAMSQIAASCRAAPYPDGKRALSGDAAEPQASALPAGGPPRPGLLVQRRHPGDRRGDSSAMRMPPRTGTTMGRKTSAPGPTISPLGSQGRSWLQPVSSTNGTASKRSKRAASPGRRLVAREQVAVDLALGIQLQRALNFRHRLPVPAGLVVNLGQRAAVASRPRP